jgi:hypothetical protein
MRRTVEGKEAPLIAKPMRPGDASADVGLSLGTTEMVLLRQMMLKFT